MGPISSIIGAAQDDCFGPRLDQALDHAAIGQARRISNFADDQFLVNDAVHERAVGRSWDQDVQSMLLQPILEKILFHRERCTQQPNLDYARCRRSLSGWIGNVQQRNCHRLLDVLRQFVHRVATYEQHLRTCCFEPPRGFNQQRLLLQPLPRMLQCLYLGEVERPQEQPRRCGRAARFAHALVDQAVIMGRTLPAHPADQSEHLHVRRW